MENVLLGYLSALAFYKFFYILNWVHRYYNEVIIFCLLSRSLGALMMMMMLFVVE